MKLGLKAAVLPLAVAVAWGALNPISVNAASCESLRTISLSNTTVTAVELRPAGPFQAPGMPAPPTIVLPSYCRIEAVIAPSSDSQIRMEIWMPAENWNGKFQAVGNGGWAGNLAFGSGALQGVPRNMAFALREGYATASNDTGHTNDGSQARFALGHPEKLVDFAYRAVHEMTVKSKAMIAAFYGNGPRLSYWNGCSTGGRQALIAAQRFPEDFDGIVAGAPANYWTHLMSGIVWAAQATHKDQPGNMPQDKLAFLKSVVVRACDAQDGVTDGLLEDPTRCKFDVKQLQCQGPDGVSCLTAAQVEAALKMYTGAVNPRTKELIYPGMVFGSESAWDPINGLQPFAIAESHFKYIVYKDPDWDFRKLDFDTGVALADKTDDGLINAIDPNLQPFFSRGGKLIQYHGWNDQQISPINSINYYKSVEARLGGASRLSNSYRLFMAPAMNHCGGGDGPNQFSPMSALERWRESNTPPDQILATHVTNGVVDMTRPLCPYPQVAVYKGGGSIRDASNFTCKVP